MGVVSAPVRAPACEAPAEPRETGGLTTRLILDYVGREGGRDAVEQLLASCGLQAREEQLRDENNWCSFETKIAMLEAAAKVLDDPLAARHVGQAGMDFNVAPALKASLRALGSLRLLYRNIPRTCSKFSTVHRMDALEVGSHHARIAYTDISGKGYHPADCELNIGFLSCAPCLFGLPLARVSHPVCAKDGGGTCIYDIHWQSGASRMRKVLTSLLAGVGVVAASLAADPAVLPEAGVAAGAAAVWALAIDLRFRNRRLQLAEARADQEADASKRLATSLQDLVSELRLDEVLAKITTNAQVAVHGKEFVLLVSERGRMSARSASILPETFIAALERWAAGNPELVETARLEPHLAEVPELAELPADRTLPLRSLASAPLVYRGRPLGLLVALSNGDDGFLPHDVELLESYAAQAAIALANARLYEAQEELASRDPLTGLLNHREFHEAVARELESCRRHGGSVSVVLVDLDQFKQVNDTSGHAAGDRVLTEAATRLRSCCRTEDLAFRIGGDEFALVLRHTSVREAIPVAERAVAAVSGIDARVSASYGIGEWPSDGPTKEALLRHADANLYAMKRLGAGRASAAATAVAVAPPASDAERQRARLACANRLSARLTPLLDPEAIARATVDELQATFGYHLVAVQRVCEDGMLRPLAGAGPRLGEVEGFTALELPLDRGVNGRVARTGEPALVLDTANDPDYYAAGDLELRSQLAVAIRVAGEVWGVLDLEDLSPGAFDTDDVVFADLLAAHVAAAIDRTRLFGELEGTFMTTLGALCDALERKDAYTAAHAREVEDLSERVARRLGLSGEELRTVRYGALLHDIGKIAISNEILNKPGKLTDEEFEEIKQHTIIGARMLERIPFFADVHPLVRSAHERWDGRGYPDGLAASDIPLGARIVCACDAFHAMTSDRPYRAAMSAAEAIEELRTHAGRQFDPAVVDALVAEVMAELAA